MASSIIPYCQHCKIFFSHTYLLLEEQKDQLSGRLFPKHCLHQIVAAVRAKAGPCELKVKDVDMSNFLCMYMTQLILPLMNRFLSLDRMLLDSSCFLVAFDQLEQEGYGMTETSSGVTRTHR